MKRRLIFAAIAAFFIASTWGLINRTAGAESAWPWQNYKLLQSEVATRMFTPACKIGWVDAELNGRATSVCEDAEDVRSGLRLAYSPSDYNSVVVGFAPGNVFYPINNLTNTVTTLYSPATDSLVLRAGRELRVFAHFSTRLHLQSDDPSQKTVVFDMSHPEYTSPPEWLVNALGMSANGKWVAVEMMGHGVGLLNLTNDSFKEVIDGGPTYGYGNDPSMQLAVTNDGSVVAITGSNVTWQLVYTENCGRPTPESPMVNCAQKGEEGWIGYLNPHDTSNPRFNDTGTELTFNEAEWSGIFRRLVIGTGSRPSPLTYLALGDSFTSGEGETEDSEYIAGTNDPGELCHVSSRSYPFLIGAQMGLSSTKSVACSGATTSDITGDASAYKGQSGRLVSDSATQRSKKQQQAVADFIPGRVPQDVFIDTYQPAVITVGIGGNDAGLFGKLKACAMPDTCEWISPAGRAETAHELAALYPRLVATYSKIHDLSPESKLYAVAYPDIIDADGQCGLLGLFFNHDERQLMSEGIHYLDQVIGAAAKTVGIPVLEDEHALDGHGICDDNLAMNTLRLGDDSEVINGLDWTRVIGDETFHPTPYGHQLLAGAIMRDVADLTTYVSSCGEVVCPEQTAVPPADTWLAGSAAAVPLSKQAALTDADIHKGDPLTITVPQGEFAPGSEVHLSVHSDDINLLDASVGNDGSVQLQSALPSNLEPGYHTVHLSGTNLLGEPVDLYQTVLYEADSTPTIKNGMDSNALTSLIHTVSKGVNDILSGQAGTADDRVADTSALGGSTAVLGDATTTRRGVASMAPTTAQVIPAQLFLGGIVGIGLIIATAITLLITKKTKNSR